MPSVLLSVAWFRRLHSEPLRTIAALTTNQPKGTANSHRAHASPHGEVDRLFLCHRQLERAKLGLMRVLGVTETAICQPQDSGRDEHDGRHLDCAHVVSSS